MENNFEKLVNTIQDTHTTLQQNALRSINKHLTIRNWLIGFYIVEFEQNGEDRARYGEKLLPTLAETLNQGMFSYRNLRLFRQFYLHYPQIGEVVAKQAQAMGLAILPIWQSPIAKLLVSDNQGIVRVDEIVSQTVFHPGCQSDPHKLIDQMSYTHLVQLLSIENAAKRFFYETECIQGNWSVSELKRQINTLYFERSGMSLAPEKLTIDVQTNSQKMNVADSDMPLFVSKYLVELPSKEQLEHFIKKELSNF